MCVIHQLKKKGLAVNFLIVSIPAPNWHKNRCGPSNQTFIMAAL